ncbi:hypothetical protein, partial [Rhodococcus marinonascens]|uniref:hypothetical protein n=1 Tax=Rhodococcus marinonascens TaxID=38311 RepID=UPI000B26CC49
HPVWAEQYRVGVPSVRRKPVLYRCGQGAGVGLFGECAGQDGAVAADRARDVERWPGFAMAAVVSLEQRAGTLRIRVVIGDFKEDHNHRHRHSSLGYRTSAEYAARCTHIHQPVGCEID